MSINDEAIATQSTTLNSAQSVDQVDHHNPLYIHSSDTQELRRSSRPSKPPVWLTDYIVQPKKFSCQYPISPYVSYDQLSPAYQASLATHSTIVERSSFNEVGADPKWVKAMQAEILDLEENNNWSIVDLSQGKIPIECKWVFKVKYWSNGEVESYKSRLVAKGYRQQEVLDQIETFSPVTKMVAMRAVVALAAASSWYIFQMDVHNVFLQGELVEEVCM
ncbi:uncharacterized mitochondrial protein AtMg00820-like [Nicotiana sylvestris]|uniref:uncharacterized mitochondrial protein AtMg00820-like n=1 Tax=Nicotiana sylvestris TaxID=4096 RepID=UPI00388CD48C